MHSKFKSIKNNLNIIFILVLELKIGTESNLHSVKSLPLILIGYKLPLYKWTKRVKAKIKRIKTKFIEQYRFLKDYQEVRSLEQKPLNQAYEN